MSHNFLQWNAQQSNQESDAQYAADTLRSNGATIGPSVFPSSTANKLFYQLTTFAKAFADAMGAKGYTLSDASASTLAAQLLNVMTQADMAPYALLNSPGFVGVPTAPQPPVGTRSLQLATTAMFSSEFGAAVTLTTGWQKLPSGVILQWGYVNVPTGNGDVITMPASFPVNFQQIIAMDWGTATYSISGGPSSLSTAKIWARDIVSGSYTSATIRYWAVGA